MADSVAGIVISNRKLIKEGPDKTIFFLILTVFTVATPSFQNCGLPSPCPAALSSRTLLNLYHQDCLPRLLRGAQ